MTSPASTLRPDPLRMAVDAERALWDLNEDHPAQRLRARNDAVRAAVAAGYTNDEIARALQMRPSDIERLLALPI